ncbi:MAG: class I SAM-dependent RNA methyltransferase [Treponema sp.]|nr:class I SAM-dependent RNA methyltransferase [Treponema sp.]
MITYVALCAVGAERILGNEIKLLGYKLAGNTPGRVAFTGDEDAMYRANFCLRTSDRVYIQMASYDAPDFDALFEGCYAAPWQEYLKVNSRVHVDKVRTYRSSLESEHAVQGMIQKAIYQKLCDKYNVSSMPESGTQSDVRVYIENDRAHILLDTSGEPLHKRGYRTAGVLAPIRETTAAILLQELFWKRKLPLHDPFCGSGTIPIEAFLFAHDVAPGLGRDFSYTGLKVYDERRAVEIKKELAGKIRTDVLCRISGSDRDPEAVSKARKNAEHAAVMAGRALQMIGSDAKLERPVFTVSDVADVKAPCEDAGVLLCNPPYGERMGNEAEASALYGRMAALFDNFPGWSMGVITSKKGFQKDIGHYADKLKSIKAGNLDTTLYIYPRN